MSVPFKKEDPIWRIQLLEAEIEDLIESRHQDLIHNGDVHVENAILSDRVEALEKEKNDIAEVAASINFVACAREFVQDFEYFNLTKDISE